MSLPGLVPSLTTTVRSTLIGIALSFFLSTTMVVFGQGTILWNESVNGPFSQSSSTPTVLGQLALGTNTIIGMTEIEPTGPSWAAHPDFFTFQIPNNLAVRAVYLNLNKPSVWTWLGDPAFLSQTGFSFGPANGELLAQLGLSSLAAGSYGMYMDNEDSQAFTSIANYRLDFFVQSIPEPSTLSFLLLGLGLVGLRGWKKTKSFQDEP